MLGLGGQTLAMMARPINDIIYAWPLWPYLVKVTDYTVAMSARPISDIIYAWPLWPDSGHDIIYAWPF